MKFFHLSDLHLGKRLFEFSLIEDQKYILSKILDVAKAEMPDAVIIAGDIYDKPVPTAEAVALFDEFLSSLHDLSLKVMVISGNHDSPERIAFASQLLNRADIYMSPVWDGNVSPISLTDAVGTVNFYLLPFIKPAHVRRYYPDFLCQSYTDAVGIAVSQMNIDRSERNVLITHQFITGAARLDSEEISVGGSDNVDVSVLDGFDYVALGHIHTPQSVCRDTVRYSGTPLKYSFSEASHKKSITVVEMGEKGDVAIKLLPLTPLRDMRELRGSYEELTLRKNYENTACHDYLRITLTDEDDIPDAMSRLRVIYPNLMRILYDNKRTQAMADMDFSPTNPLLTPLEMFCDFFEMQNGRPMDDSQHQYIEELIDKIKVREEKR